MKKYPTAAIVRSVLQFIIMTNIYEAKLLLLAKRQNVKEND